MVKQKVLHAQLKTKVAKTKARKRVPKSQAAEGDGEGGRRAAEAGKEEEPGQGSPRFPNVPAEGIMRQVCIPSSLLLLKTDDNLYSTDDPELRELGVKHMDTVGKSMLICPFVRSSISESLSA
jgi:hypothetical protein